jgi:hypothetical protein
MSQERERERALKTVRFGAGGVRGRSEQTVRVMCRVGEHRQETSDCESDRAVLEKVV